MLKSVPNLFVAAVVAAIAGCGGSAQYSTAPVSGQLTSDGMPVTEGQLMFIPESSGNTDSGKPGAATVQADGTFVVSTYSEGDGAVIGKHTIEYIAPPPRPASGSGDSNPSANSGHQTEEVENVPSPFAKMVVQQNSVEIKSGENILEINLMK